MVAGVSDTIFCGLGRDARPPCPRRRSAVTGKAAAGVGLGCEWWARAGGSRGRLARGGDVAAGAEHAASDGGQGQDEDDDAASGTG